MLHFSFGSDFHRGFSVLRDLEHKALLFICLSGLVIRITRVWRFGAASASMLGNKEAAYSSNMTFTLFDTPRHYPNRSDWRNGAFYCLS